MPHGPYRPILHQWVQADEEMQHPKAQLQQFGQAMDLCVCGLDRSMEGPNLFPSNISITEINESNEPCPNQPISMTRGDHQVRLCHFLHLMLLCSLLSIRRLRRQA